MGAESFFSEVKVRVFPPPDPEEVKMKIIQVMKK